MSSISCARIVAFILLLASSKSTLKTFSLPSTLSKAVFLCLETDFEETNILKSRAISSCAAGREPTVLCNASTVPSWGDISLPNLLCISDIFLSLNFNCPSTLSILSSISCKASSSSSLNTVLLPAVTTALIPFIDDRSFSNDSLRFNRANCCSNCFLNVSAASSLALISAILLSNHFFVLKSSSDSILTLVPCGLRFSLLITDLPLGVSGRCTSLNFLLINAELFNA